MTGEQNEFKHTPNSYWIQSTPETDYPKLEKDERVDVAIVGGGIVGLTSAYLLVREGLKVAVVEADRILHGTTGHSTAKITSQHALIYAKIKKEMSEELARQYAQANENAIHLIAGIADENKIDCDFSWQPAYVYTQTQQMMKPIEDEAKVAADLGIKASIVDSTPLPFQVKAALRYENQAQFHPLKYLKALARQITDKGSYIFENTVAVDISGDPPAILSRDGKKVRADKVIIASHYPFFDGGALYFSRIYAEKSYIIAIRAQEKFPDGMYISAEDPARSLRSQGDKDGELILVAGEHHKTGDGENLNAHYRNLISFANNNFRVKDIVYRWSTQDCMTVDGVPYAGHLTPRSPNLYVATGFGKWGISNGTASAMILRDLITKGDSPWAPVYNPSRFNLVALKSFAVQNADVAREYVTGKLSKLPEEIDIAKGEARNFEKDGQILGGYRDDQGELHVVDRTCTHLGCETKWNDAERTWDCPCHGSRFTIDGDVVEGPAFNPLQPAGEEQSHVEARVFK